jgi:hypothetical protein
MHKELRPPESYPLEVKVEDTYVPMGVFVVLPNGERVSEEEANRIGRKLNGHNVKVKVQKEKEIKRQLSLDFS